MPSAARHAEARTGKPFDRWRPAVPGAGRRMLKRLRQSSRPYPYALPDSRKCPTSLVHPPPAKASEHEFAIADTACTTSGEMQTAVQSPPSIGMHGTR